MKGPHYHYTGEYSDEFIREIVELIEVKGYSIEQAASFSDVDQELISNLG